MNISKFLIQKDDSNHKELGLYNEDTIDNVKIIEIRGKRTDVEDSTEIEIFNFR